MSSGSGTGAVRREDNVYSGSFVGSGSCSSGCGVKVHILKWSECDTIGKMAGFIIGQGLQSAGRLIKSAVQLFHLDKATEYFFRFMRWSCENTCSCCEKVSEFASTYIKPIFVNACTKWAWNATYDNLLSHAGRLIRTVAKFIFKTILWESVCVPLWKHVIKPIAQKLCPERKPHEARVESVRRRCLPEWVTNGLKTLADWTIVPFWNRVLSPFFGSVGDFFYGAFSGTLRTKTEESAEEERAPKTTGERLKEKLENIDTEFPVLYQFLTSAPEFTLSEEVHLHFAAAFGDEITLDPATDRDFLETLNRKYGPEIAYIRVQEEASYPDNDDWHFSLNKATSFEDTSVDDTINTYAKARPDLQIPAFLREVILYAIGIR